MIEQLHFLNELDYDDNFNAGIKACIDKLENLHTNNVGMLHPDAKSDIDRLKGLFRRPR